MSTQLILDVITAAESWIALVRGCCVPKRTPSGMGDLIAPPSTDAALFFSARDRVHAAIEAARNGGEKHPALQTLADCVQYYWDDPPPQRPVIVLENCFAAAVNAVEYLQADGGGKRTRKAGHNRPRRQAKLTSKQSEVVHVVGECRGNLSAAAKQLGLDRKTVKQQYDAACTKLGATATDKTRVKGLPHDRRRQVQVGADEDRRK